MPFSYFLVLIRPISMNKDNKTPVIVIAVIFLSFAYGVGSNWLKSKPEAPEVEKTEVQEPASKPVVAPAATIEPAATKIKSVPHPTKAAGGNPKTGSFPINPYAEMMKKMGQNKAPQGKAPPHPLNPNNPHPYLHPGQAAQLNNTLDSIRPGQIEEKRLRKRNLYFEKLSEQLKELQGKQKNQKEVSPPVPEKPEKGEDLDLAEPGEEMIDEELPEGAPLDEEDELIDEDFIDDEELIDEQPEEDFVDDEFDDEFIDEGF